MTETTKIEAQTVLPNGRIGPKAISWREKQIPRPGLAQPPYGGARYAYFEGSFTGFEELARRTATRSGTTNAIALLSTFPNAPFAAIYETYVAASKSARYKITATTTGSVRIFVDAELVVDDDGLRGPRDLSGERVLGPGFHALRVEYLHRRGVKSLEVKVTGPLADD